MESLQAVQKSWQIANGDYIDVPAFGAPDDGTSLVWDAGSGAFVKATLATSAALAAHIADTANPHGVTAAQVGSYTIASADAAIAAAVATHAAAADPHSPYLLATGARAGASSQAQTFTNGIKSPKTIAITDSTNAGGWYKANGMSQDVYYDSTNGYLGIGVTPTVPLHVKVAGNYSATLALQTALHTWSFVGGDAGYSSTTTTWKYDGLPFVRFVANSEVHFFGKMSVATNAVPTAVLELGAGGTAAASLRIRSGAAPTSPNDGDAWKLSDTFVLFGEDATTNAVVNTLRLRRSSSGTPAAGFGAGLNVQLKSSTTQGQDAGRINWKWTTATHASRASQADFTTFYTSTERTSLSIGSDASNPLIGFYGVAPVARQLLATGAGATVDQVITLLQNLGLARQS